MNTFLKQRESEIHQASNKLKLILLAVAVLAIAVIFSPLLLWPTNILVMSLLFIASSIIGISLVAASVNKINQLQDQLNTIKHTGDQVSESVNKYHVFFKNNKADSKESVNPDPSPSVA